MTDRSPGKGRVQRSPRDVGILDEDQDDDENQDRGDQDEDIYYQGDLDQGDFNEDPDHAVEMTIINLQYEMNAVLLHYTVPFKHV